MITYLSIGSRRWDRLEALYVLAIYTGMRQGELLALRWEDVDLDAGVLRVRGTKTARSCRTVKLSETALEALTSHLTRQLEEIDGLGGVHVAGERPLLAKAGLPQIRFHDLRHTCATILLSQGVHAKIVQELLGHATIAITLDTYSHVLPA